MKTKGIVLKLSLIIFTLFLSVLLPFALLMDRIFLNVYSLYLNENVKSIAHRIEAEIVENGTTPEEIFKDLSVFIDHEILFFNKDGYITNGDFMEFHNDYHISSEWQSRLQRGETLEGERFNANVQESFYFVVQPIIEEEQFLGGVIFFSSISELHDKMHVVRDWIIRAILAAIILVLAYTFFLTWYLSRPLIKMEKVTRQIAKGNLDMKIDIATNDELGSLAKAINDLSVELNNYRKNRSEFLANISHELRTPTSYLNGYAKLIKDHKYKDINELQRYATIIEEESNRLASLILDLFELSKMEEGEYKLYIQEIDLEDFIQSLSAKVALKAEEKGLDFNVTMNLNDRSLFTDGMRLEQILLNLIENAINYTSEGKVMLAIDTSELGIRFTVSDTGIGIPEADIPFIFERFHRVDKSRTRSTGGTGLGLSIVAELVKQISGEIYVESEEHKETIFTLGIPYKLVGKSKNLLSD